ncbi:two-component system, OmpR family, KDP operon response regulator KdpE [Dehalogenimonas formicexedens]|uniref:Two-component system, OmpR family, KDP operon response regulator KdpE n=1 Tax=Dehalogenimonas formicexedens TaxID=1839801 RepID=A0A1P8F5N0_9CHLR|nr:response regulator transcription factor [Dehalogenimonas formicexedens]APV43783.1 two-component system, OmpR family, KDP operon response regulator KdpE [Dehalogenimonas formicexedens]
MKLLIIEDDPNIVDTVSYVLSMAWPDIHVTSSSNGNSGVALAEKLNPDAILLDLGLPDIDGYEVLKQIRTFSFVPIIIITVRGDENALVKAFALDANDYLVKPFRQMELIARLKAALKKRRLLEEDLSVTYSNIRFGASIQEVYLGDNRVFLTATEARLLYHLIRKAGQIVTNAELSEILWGDYISGSSDNIKNYICRLRKKIETKPDQPEIILNRRGIGYMIPPPH